MQLQIGICQSLEIPNELSMKMRLFWKIKATGESVPLDVYDKIEMVFKEKKNGPELVVLSSEGSSPDIVVDSDESINIIMDKSLFSNLTETGIYRLNLYEGESGIRLLYGTFKMV